MLHEIKNIIKAAQSAETEGIKTVLASVVSLDGSSYRRPGVRMSIQENGEMIGAVSGGCVEKEVRRQAQSVFETGASKLMVYDGRYRLGCEGILYILIEPLELSKDFLSAFDKQCKSRKGFTIDSWFSTEENHRLHGYSIFNLTDGSFAINSNQTDGLELFTQQLKPGFNLQIVGSEQDRKSVV